MGLYGNKFKDIDTVNPIDTYFNELCNYIHMTENVSYINEAGISFKSIKDAIMKVIDTIIKKFKDIIRWIREKVSKFGKKQKQKKWFEINNKFTIKTHGKDKGKRNFTDDDGENWEEMYSNLADTEYEVGFDFSYGKPDDDEKTPDVNIKENSASVNSELYNNLIKTCQSIQKNLNIYFDTDHYLNNDTTEYVRQIENLISLMTKPNFSLYAELDEGILDDEDGMMEIHKELLKDKCIDGIDFRALTIDFDKNMKSYIESDLMYIAMQEKDKINTPRQLAKYLADNDNDIDLCKDTLEDIHNVYVKLKMAMEKYFTRLEIENGEKGEYLPYKKGKDLKLVQSILRTVKLDTKIINFICTQATKSEIVKIKCLDRINLCLS